MFYGCKIWSPQMFKQRPFHPEVHRFTFIFISFISLLFSLPAYSEITSISSAINKSGRQRMLTQKMVKAYCMIGIDVQRDKAGYELSNAITKFDTQLSELKSYAPSEAIKKSLAKVEKIWLPFKAVLQLPVSRDNAEELLETNDELLRASHKVVLQLQDASGSDFGRLVNISGRQRMLSQRLAKWRRMNLTAPWLN
jgi:nitrate/nitrite-specific signal transduction histidine kinase